MSVLDGLRAVQKTLPATLLYDSGGAALFEEIAELDEYYLTRTEVSIFRQYAAAIVGKIGPGSTLIEFGSGDGRKIRLLLDAVPPDERPAAYVAVDVAHAQLDALASELERDFVDLTVVPIVADFTTPESSTIIANTVAGRVGRDHRRVAFFPGSTIGNFHPEDAVALLRRFHDICGATGGLVLGADYRKDPDVLHAAYNDARGVTAEFNVNVLRRLNRECGADFALDEFRHYAFYNPVPHRIEMHLVSLRDQEVHLAGETLRFARGESIWTESSYKYDDASLHALLAAAGWRVCDRWTDADQAFGVWYCEPLAELSA